MKRKWFGFLVLLIGLVPHGILAKSPDTASIDHQIVLIKDLIEDYAESNWTVVTQSGGTFGDAIGGVDRARLGVETGYFTNARQYVDDDSVQKEVIEVNAQPIGIDQIQEVRGAYLVTLPQFKRIQLEIDYEVLITNESGVLDEYYVEVFERNQLNRDEWVSIETIKKNEELKAAPLNILENKEEKFSVVSYVANLSKWSGREIRLDLVSHIQNNIGMKPGRWTRLRLVGATFDYKFVDFDEKSTVSGGISALSVRESKFTPQFDPYVSPGYASYVIPDLNFYADTGPAPAFINNRWNAGSFEHENNVNAGIGGLSTSILNDTEHRVVCNVIYNTYLNMNIMLCWNFETHNTYLYTCNNLATQQWSTGIMLSMPSTEVGIRLVGNSGDDKIGGQNMMLYTRERAYPGYDTILEERALWLEQ